jgi:hypothetical protein
MEIRNDWFDILMDGLPADEQRHVVQAIAKNDAAKRRHIQLANAREVKRIEQRRLTRSLDPELEPDDEDAFEY